MPDYLPVPVFAAEQIATVYHKDIVVIFTIDRAHHLAHYTTFGRAAEDKLHAAGYGDLIAGIISVERLSEVTVFEDFRLEAAKVKADRDALLAACKLFERYYAHGSVVQFEEVREAVRAAIAQAEPK